MVPPMTDWKAMAGALALGIPEADLSRTIAPVAGLEAVFQQYAATLTSGEEPAVVFDPASEDPTR
jgi:hypothetical protein